MPSERGVCVKLCSKERVLALVSYLFMSVNVAVQRHDVGSKGHGIRLQTAPNKAMRSDGKQGLIIPVYLFFHTEHSWNEFHHSWRKRNCSRHPLDRIVRSCVSRFVAQELMQCKLQGAEGQSLAPLSNEECR